MLREYTSRESKISSLKVLHFFKFFSSVCFLELFYGQYRKYCVCKSFFVRFGIDTEEKPFCLCNIYFGDFRADLHL